MSSIMRRRNGLIAWSVMGRLLSGVRVATPHLQTGRASYLSPPRAPGGGALPRERFSPLARSGRSVFQQTYGLAEGNAGDGDYGRRSVSATSTQASFLGGTFHDVAQVVGA